MNRTRVLLADDHALVRAGIRNALNEQANLHIVGEVGDGPSLLPAIEQWQPDLLLIDVTMPDFDPITQVKEIRLRYPTLLILVVSAYDDNVYVQGLLRVGVNGYHLKDQPLGDLRLAVERVLAGKRWISSSLVDKLVQPETAVSTNLSSRQLDILHLLCKGLDNRAIAARLGLSIKTIETHLTRLYRQLDVSSRLEAANFAHMHPDILNRTIQAAPPHPDLLPQEQHGAILIVDDSQRYRQQLRRMMTRISPKAAIYEAERMTEARQLTYQTQPRLIFVDVLLGDENGIQCTRVIREQAPQARIILISAYPDREFHKQGLTAGANAFLDKKDIDAATLYQIVKDAFD